MIVKGERGCVSALRGWRAGLRKRPERLASGVAYQLRFGPDLPAEMEERLRGTADFDQLDRWLEAAVRARTLKKIQQSLEV
jgi:hypothetical protein